MKSLFLYMGLLYVLLVTSARLHGQSLFGLDSENYEVYLQSVKQFSEFVDRFNLDSYKIPDSNTDFKRVLDRKQSILMLFYLQDPRFSKDSSLYSENYVAGVLQFIENVVERKVYIGKHSDQIKAIATALVNYKNQPQIVKISLSQQVEDPDLVRWVITGIDGNFLMIPERDSTQLRFLSPVSHELGFMDLKRAMMEPNVVIDYTREDFTYDMLSVFLYALFEGSLEFMEIVSVDWEVTLMDKVVLKLGERAINESLFGIVIYDLYYLK